MGEIWSKHSKITAKHQITVPREVRDRLKLGPSDRIQWRCAEDGRIYVTIAEAPIAQYQGAVRVGIGDIQADIEAARDAAVDRYR